MEEKKKDLYGGSEKRYKKLLETNRLKIIKKHNNENNKNFSCLEVIKNLKQIIEKEIPIDIEQMISDIYLDFIKQINMPYWFSGKMLNKIFINKYIVVIKYLDIIKDVLHRSSFIKIKYENSNSYNDDLVHNDLMLLDNNIRIYCNQEFIKITPFFILQWSIIKTI